MIWESQFRQVDAFFNRKCLAYEIIKGQEITAKCRSSLNTRKAGGKSSKTNSLKKSYSSYLKKLVRCCTNGWMYQFF